MANIDVTELLTDPDFIDPVLLIHRKPYVDQFGENRLKEEAFQTIGSVQPASAKAIRRLPDALQVADLNSFWIKGSILADGQCVYPDIIVFRNNRYQVQTVSDWTNYGQGWCEGTAVRERPAG